jgi:hypothetical protein
MFEFIDKYQIGVFVSIVGFVFTIWNVMRSKSAAQQAADATARIRKDISRMDSVADCTQAIAAMNAIKRFHRNKAWEILPERYTELRKALISIKNNNPLISDEYKKKMQSAIQHTSSIEKKVEEALELNQAPPDAAKINFIMSKMVDNLQIILENIKQGIGR